MAKINGEFIGTNGKTIAEYLSETNYDPKRIVIERNGEIVTKSQYAEMIIEENDVIEVISFVGGG